MIKKIVYEFDSTEEAQEHFKYLEAGKAYESFVLDTRKRIEDARDEEVSKEDALNHIEELIEENNKYGY